VDGAALASEPLPLGSVFALSLAFPEEAEAAFASGCQKFVIAAFLDCQVEKESSSSETPPDRDWSWGNLLIEFSVYTIFDLILILNFAVGIQF
jgi:hypothetical protein